MQGVAKAYAEFHGVTIPPEIARQCVILSERYITDRFLPDKAIDLLDEACSDVNLRCKEISRLAELRKERDDYELELKMLTDDADGTHYERLAKIRSRICQIENEIEQLEKIPAPAVTMENLARIIELWTKIPASKIKEQEYNQAKLEEWLAYMATYTTVPPATQAPVGGTTTSSGGNATTGGNAVVNNSKWLRPCSYVKMTSPFGMRESPTAGASTYHQGVDLAGPEGTPIYATRAGRVTTASYSNSAGYYVSINHLDGYSSIYMHMTNYVVGAGSTVSAGQLIGYMGNTGISTGSHLHFGVSLNGRYINPCGLVPI
jgi:murein DD-endopeptidase MepM/ murein hydrolase activator NlpD